MLYKYLEEYLMCTVLFAEQQDGHLLCLLYNGHGAKADIRTLAFIIFGSKNISHIEVLHQVEPCSNIVK